MLRYHTFLFDQGDTLAGIKMWDLREGYFSGVYGAWSKVKLMEDTDYDFNKEEISITSSHPSYRKWWWLPRTEILQIGTDFARASHKEGEDRVQDALITCFGVRRHSDGTFFGSGQGAMTYNAPPLKAGSLAWNIVRYTPTSVMNPTVEEPAWGSD